MDKINPDHYKVGTPYECRRIIEEYGWDKDHCLASAFEYMCRAGHKPGEDEATDIRKAIWNLQRKLDRTVATPTQEKAAAQTEKLASAVSHKSRATAKCANADHAARVLVARAAYKAGKRDSALVQHVARHCHVKWGEAAQVCRELGYLVGKRGRV